jgi:hypothetical protein
MDIPVNLRDDLCGDWKSKLLRSPVTGQPKPILANALLALREAPDWAGVLARDEFALVTMAMLPPRGCAGWATVGRHSLGRMATTPGQPNGCSIRASRLP